MFTVADSDSSTTLAARRSQIYKIGGSIVGPPCAVEWPPLPAKLRKSLLAIAHFGSVPK